MKNLIKKLKEFDEERRNALRTPEKWDDEAVAKCFVPIAKYVLLNGYFLVNDKYIIDLGAIELYYHEEDGNIKDHIMYHTNEHPSKSKVYKLNNGFPYFKIGSFNLHQSGIDVTFENDANKAKSPIPIKSPAKQEQPPRRYTYLLFSSGSFAPSTSGL